jgi:hypothetical protein
LIFSEPIAMETTVKRPVAAFTAVAIATIGTQWSIGQAAEGRPVFLGWQTSCGVDAGAINHVKDTYVFHNSSNHCSGGIFHQRAELNSTNISVTSRITYVFETKMSMKTSGDNDFILFQVHDGRMGCSPPMSLRWTGGNTLRFDSDYTRGKGMGGCFENWGLRNAIYDGQTLKRDGTTYDLAVTVAFEGKGSFDVTVRIDGAVALSGKYEPSSDPQFLTSKRFFMKHGVYSQDRFEYEMRSTGMRVLRQG